MPDTPIPSKVPSGGVNDVGRPAFLCGLIGSGIQQSRTPALHMGEGDAQGFRLLYKIIDLNALGVGAEALPELLQAAERMGFAGLNITHPCKQAVIPLLTELSPHAEVLHAVNTVVLQGGKRIGHNTDWWGFAENFRRNMDGASLDRVVQMGAGGAGAAVADALLELGVQHLTVVDVEPSRAQAVADSLVPRFGAGRAVAGTAEAVREADGLVNTTPIGMDKYPGMPLDAALLRPELWVSEIIYFPLETELLRRARALGCRTLDGGGMAVFQAVEAFRLFTGAQPDPERMLRHFASM